MIIDQYYSLKEFLELDKTICSVIYCIECLITRKVYIGKTSRSVVKRIKSHISQSVCDNNRKSAIHFAIKKYGIDSFRCKILDICETEEQLILSEIKCIKEYDSNHIGYNLTEGGEGISGYRHSESVKENIRNKKKGIPINSSQRLNLNKRVNRIDIDSNEVIEQYESIVDAYRKTGIHNISQCCNGKLDQAGGFKWEFVSKEDSKRSKWSDSSKEKMKNRLKECNSLNRKVYQLDLNGLIIREFSSIKEAYEITNIKNISSVCRGVRKTAGGYKWRYID